MKNQHFIISLIATLVFHIIIFAFLTYTASPDKTPISTPDVKTSELNITPYDIKKTKSTELNATSEELSNSKPATNKVNQGNIKTSKAEVQKLKKMKIKSKDTNEIIKKTKEKVINTQPLKQKIQNVLKSKNKPLISKVISQKLDIKKDKIDNVDLKLETVKTIDNNSTETLTLQLNSDLTKPNKLKSNKILVSAPAPPILKNKIIKADIISGEIIQPNNKIKSVSMNPKNIGSSNLNSEKIDYSNFNSDTIFESATNEVTEKLAKLELPSTFAVAGLAWTGDSGNKSVDPTSLAAIQAFIQQGDIDQSQSNIGEVRDGISQTLGTIPCSRVQAQFVPENGTLQLNGHIPEENLREPVIIAMQQQMGGDIKVVDNMLILPRPQCSIISAITAVGLPQSTDQLTNPLLIGEDAHVKEYSYQQGDRLKLEMTSPHYNAHIYVDYFDASGMVLHLQPNEIVSSNYQAANTNLSIGKEIAGQPSLKIMIAPPFGQEIAVAFASSENLYDALRPTIEPAKPYLNFLKKKIDQARLSNNEFKGEWVYFFISTSQ